MADVGDCKHFFLDLSDDILSSEKILNASKRLGLINGIYTETESKFQISNQKTWYSSNKKYLLFFDMDYNQAWTIAGMYYLEIFKTSEIHNLSVKV